MLFNATGPSSVRSISKPAKPASAATPSFLSRVQSDGKDQVLIAFFILNYNFTVRAVAADLISASTVRTDSAP